MAENIKPQDGAENTYKAPELSKKALAESRKVTTEFKDEVGAIIGAFHADAGVKLDKIVGKKKIELLNKAKELDSHVDKIQQVSFVLEGQKSELKTMKTELEVIRNEVEKITEDLKIEINEALKEHEDAVSKKELGETAQAWGKNIEAQTEGEDEKKKQMAEWKKQKIDLENEQKELKKKQGGVKPAKGKKIVTLSAENQKKVEEIKVEITQLDAKINDSNNKPKNIDVNKVKFDYLKDVLKKDNKEAKLLKKELEKSKNKKPKFFEHLKDKALEEKELEEMLLILHRWESESVSIEDNSVDILKEKNNLLVDLGGIESMLVSNQNIENIKDFEKKVKKVKLSINKLKKDSDPDEVINIMNGLNILKGRVQEKVDVVVGKMSETRVKTSETEVKKKKKIEKQEKNIETVKTKSKEIPASLLADFVEVDKKSSSKAVAETVNYILATELKDFANTNPDSSSYVEAIENMFDNTAPDAKLVAKLKKYGIEDWDSFIKAWKGGLAKEKVAPAMETWLRGEMKRQAVAGLDKANKAERFKSVFVDFNKKPIAAKVMLSITAVGGGMAGGMFLFSGIGLSVAAGGAVGAGALAVVRTALRRFTKGLETFKKLDKKTAESFSEYGDKKQARMTNKFIESVGSDIAEKYFGITQTTQKPAQKKGVWGKVKGVFGKKEERQVQEVEAGQGIDSEGALTMGAIISQSLQDKEPVAEGQEYEVNGKKIILDAKTNSIFLDVTKQLAEGGEGIKDNLKIENELILKLYELQSAEQVAMTEKGWDNKLSKYIDGFFKTLGGNVDGKIKGYGGAFVAGSAIGVAMSESSMLARLGLGAAGGLTLSTRMAEGGFKQEAEQKAKGEIIKNFGDLQKNLNNYENLSDEEKKGLTERLQNLELARNVKGGDLGDILALQENPLLAIKVDALLKESKEKGLLSSPEEKELNFDFSDMEKVSQNLKKIDAETAKRFKSVDGKIVRKMTKTQRGKRAIMQLAGVVGMGAVAFGLGLGVQHLRHEITSFNIENKLDDLLAGKSEKVEEALLDMWADGDIDNVNDLSEEKLGALRQKLETGGSDWLDGQIKEAVTIRVESLLKDVPEGFNAKGLVQYWAQDLNANKVSDLSLENLQEILTKSEDGEWWKTQEIGMKEYEDALNSREISSSTESVEDVLNKDYGRFQKTGDQVKLVINELRGKNPELSVEETNDLYLKKASEMSKTITDLIGNDPNKGEGFLDGESIDKMLKENNYDIDAVTDKINQTVGYQEGISHSIMRQLEGDKESFGYKESDGDVHKWAQNKADKIVRDNSLYSDTKDVHVKNAYTGSVKVNLDESTGNFELDKNIEDDNLVEVLRSKPVEAKVVNDGSGIKSTNVEDVNSQQDTKNTIPVSEQPVTGAESLLKSQPDKIYGTELAQMEKLGISGHLGVHDENIGGQDYLVKQYSFSKDLNNNGFVDSGESGFVTTVFDKDTGKYIGAVIPGTDQIDKEWSHVDVPSNITEEQPVKSGLSTEYEFASERGKDWKYPGVPENLNATEAVKVDAHNSLDFSKSGQIQILSDDSRGGFEYRSSVFRQIDFSKNSFTKSLFNKESMNSGLARNGQDIKFRNVIPTRIAQIEVYSEALDSDNLNSSQKLLIRNAITNLSKLTWGNDLNKVFGASFLDKIGLNSDGAALGMQEDIDLRAEAEDVSGSVAERQEEFAGEKADFVAGTKRPKVDVPVEEVKDLNLIDSSKVRIVPSTLENPILVKVDDKIYSSIIVQYKDSHTMNYVYDEKGNLWGHQDETGPQAGSPKEGYPEGIPKKLPEKIIPVAESSAKEEVVETVVTPEKVSNNTELFTPEKLKDVGL